LAFDRGTIVWYIYAIGLPGGKEMSEDSLVKIIELLLNKGIDALPIVSIVLLLLVIYFYRKDMAELRAQSREDLKTSIQAIERNTSTLNTLAEISRVRLERDK